MDSLVDVLRIDVDVKQRRLRRVYCELQSSELSMSYKGTSNGLDSFVVVAEDVDGSRVVV